MRTMAKGTKMAGRCTTHNDLAWIWSDGSITCMHQLIVEHGTTDCRWGILPHEWLTGVSTGA